MRTFIADTHALIWFLTEPGRLSSSAVAAFGEARKARIPFLVSAVSLVEISYLAEKGRIAYDFPESLSHLLEDPLSGITIYPLDAEIGFAVRHIPRNQVPDMPDRIIAATALCLGIPLVTRDAKIRASGVDTIW